MAALLRSARLLKLSPSGLLHTTGTSRTGPPLGRLYSGAVGGRTAAVCSRQVASGSANASRGVWRHAAGAVRGYAVAPQQRDDPSLVVRSKQAQHFDWALAKLDNSVRRTGRITKTLLQKVFHDVCRTGYPSGNQALLLLRSCGSLLPEMPLSERTELAHRIWDKLKELGASYDASHYNAMLKVYLQNEFRFSPTDFLAKMEAANVQPNRVTYQRLIAAYCQEGDIDGASAILGFMKNKDLPITEAVFNSLVTGHARAGDMESAENILPVMRGAGIEPGPDTYVALLTAYAEKGDIDKIKQTLESVESGDGNLMDRDLMQVVFSLAKAGHSQHVPEMVERMRHERGYVPDAMNLCLSLVTQGQEDTAFSILKTFPLLSAQPSSDTPSLGNFFLRHCVNMDKPVEKMASYCKELQESNLHTSPLIFTLLCALEAKKTALCFELMKIMKQQELPIRPHFFWPLLTQHVKDKNTAGIMEVVKGMQDFGVPLDADTITLYVLPAFPNLDAATQALKGAGCSRESDGFLSSEVRSVAANNLAQLYTMLSDPSFPVLELIAFRGSLIAGFKRLDDVESMVKITQLLFTDERFSKPGSKPSDTAAYFLYNLIDTMSEADVQTQEDKLRQFFTQLKTLNISIPGSIYRGIRNVLYSYNVPELTKDVIALVDPSEQQVNGVDSSHRDNNSSLSIKYKLAKLEELKAENKPLNGALKQIILLLCAEEDLKQALELKQKYNEEMVAGSYATLISACCRHDNVDEAVNLKTELNRKDSSIVLDTSKYLNLVRILCKHDRVEEAVEVLKEMKEKGVVVKDVHAVTLFHILNSVAMKGDAAAVRRLQDTVFSLGLARPSSNLCAPAVTVHLESKDLAAALEAAMECQKSYGLMPRIHDIIVGLVEKGDTELLQKGMDYVSQERGEMTMLYDLFFAFMQVGRYREARKIIETPGLRARPGRLQWYAEKCIATNRMEPLEHLVEMTAKLFECDRDDMYCYALRLYKENNNWRKAEAAWTKMQEENLIPRERTLRLLADIFKSNGQEVPFEVPEMWYEQPMASEESAVQGEESAGEPSAPTSDDSGLKESPVRVLALCKRGKAQEAYRLVKDADKKGTVLGPAPYDHLIRTLLAEGSLEDALAVRDIAVSHHPDFHLGEIANSLLIITYAKKGQTKESLSLLRSMLQQDRLPSQLSITRLVQGLGVRGDVEGIQEVEGLIKGLGTSLNLSSMVFTNNTALAHINNGDVEAAVEGLEAVCTAPEGSGSSVAFVFRKMLEENNEKAVDRLSIMVERLANHFACYRPATDLFLLLLEMDKVDDAKFMLARCNAVAEQKALLTSYMSKLARKPGQVDKIKTLVNLIPDFIEKPVLYGYLMKSYGVDKDFVSAKALYGQMQQEGVEADDLSLKRLAALYRNAGETPPFIEPPESFKFYADEMREKSTKAQTTAEE